MDEQYAYRTGRTDPTKSSRGLIAVLLICVIFLGGLISAQSVLDIHPFQEPKDTQALSFTEGQDTQALSDTQAAEESLSLAGMALQETDPVYQELYNLPQGLFVARVDPGSKAEILGICPGDVVTALDKTAISTLEAAKEYVDRMSGFPITLWRNGKEISLTLH